MKKYLQIFLCLALVIVIGLTAAGCMGGDTWVCPACSKKCSENFCPRDGHIRPGTEQEAQYTNANPFSQPIVCWGDSLTYGYADPTEDGYTESAHRDFQQDISYPAVLAEMLGSPVVNLGVSGETIQTIMARQGADPMTTPAFTIPADTTPVKIGTYREGMLTMSGEAARILATGSSGINPCYIGGVKGSLTTVGQENGVHEIEYYFTRETPGKAISISQGTIIVTYAMRYLRGGVAVIWMGRNGEHLYTAEDMKQYVDRMVAYGGYSDYLVLACDEIDYTRSSTEGLTAEEDWERVFGSHLLYLKPLMGSVGCQEAGLHTSGTLNSRGVAAELDYDGLHFNSYGNKAIASFVYKRLLENQAAQASVWQGQAVQASTSSQKELTISRTEDLTRFELTGEDAYGSYCLKLKEGQTWSLGGGCWIDTGLVPFREGADGDDFTIVLGFQDQPSGQLTFVSDSFRYQYSDQRGISVGYDPQNADTYGGAMMSLYGFPAGGITMRESGTNTIVIRKSGETVTVWGNGTAYHVGDVTGMTLDPGALSFLNGLPLLIGADYSYPGEVSACQGTVTLTALTIYTSVIGDEMIPYLAHG